MNKTHLRKIRLQHIAAAVALLIPIHLTACGSDAPAYTDDAVGGAGGDTNVNQGGSSEGGAYAGGFNGGGNGSGGTSSGGGAGAGGSSSTPKDVAVVRVETTAVSAGATSVASCPAGHKVVTCESSVDGSGSWSTSWTHIGTDKSGNRAIVCDVLSGEASVRGAVVGNWGKLKFKMRAVCIQNGDISIVRAATPSFTSGKSAVANCPANHKVVACEAKSEGYPEWTSSWSHVGKDALGTRSLSCNVQPGEAGVQGVLSGNWDSEKLRVRAVCLENDGQSFIQRHESAAFTTGKSNAVNCPTDYRMISAEHYGSKPKTWASSWTHIGEDNLGARALNLIVDAALNSLEGDLVGDWGTESFKVRGVCVKKTFTR